MSTRIEAAAEKPYRLGALGYIFNPDEKKLLLVQLKSYKDDEWNVPGGGRNDGETAEENVVREIHEELGLNDNQFQVMAQAIKPMTYDFPPELAEEGNPVATAYRGQKKDQFLIHFTGNPDDVSMDRGELKRIMWCPVDELSEHLKFPGQFEATMEALGKFGIV